MRLTCFLLIVWLFSACSGYGQKKTPAATTSATTTTVKTTEQHIDQNFCNTLMGVVFHVSSNFDGIRGKALETSGTGTRYVSLRGITGVETSSIINDSGWRYEGIIYQDTSKNAFADFYKEYAGHLNDCLPHSGYILTERKNTDTKLSDFPDLSYRYNTGVVTIELTAEYSNINGIYTITVFVSK